MTILLGILTGAAQVGAAQWRTQKIIEGNIIHTIGSSAVISLSYFFGVLFVVNGDIPGYIAFSAGAAAITVAIAYHNKQTKRDSNTEHLA